jgi:hypothetical protein
MTALWKPTPGGRIAGEITNVGEGKSEYGPYPVYTIQTDQGDKAIHAYHAVLKRELGSRTVGDRVVIVYNGKRQSTKNKDRSFHDYQVADLVLPDDGEVPF